MNQCKALDCIDEMVRKSCVAQPTSVWSMVSAFKGTRRESHVLLPSSDRGLIFHEHWAPKLAQFSSSLPTSPLDQRDPNVGPQAIVNKLKQLLYEKRQDLHWLYSKKDTTGVVDLLFRKLLPLRRPTSDHTHTHTHTHVRFR